MCLVNFTHLLLISLSLSSFTFQSNCNVLRSNSIRNCKKIASRFPSYIPFHFPVVFEQRPICLLFRPLSRAIQIAVIFSTSSLDFSDFQPSKNRCLQFIDSSLSAKQAKLFRLIRHCCYVSNQPFSSIDPFMDVSHQSNLIRISFFFD